MVVQGKGRIGILAGSGINPENVDDLLRLTGVPEVHASCRAPVNADPPSQRSASRVTAALPLHGPAFAT